MEFTLAQGVLPAVLFFSLTHTAVMMGQPRAQWAVPTTLLLGGLGGAAGVSHVAAALALGYWGLSKHLRAHHHRTTTYQDWLLLALLLTLVVVFYWGANDRIPGTQFPLGRLRALFGFLALAAVAFYAGRTKSGVRRLWSGVHHHDTAHLYWVGTVTVFTLITPTTFPWDLVVAVAGTLTLLFIHHLLYKNV